MVGYYTTTDQNIEGLRLWTTNKEWFMQLAQINGVLHVIDTKTSKRMSAYIFFFFSGV